MASVKNGKVTTEGETALEAPIDQPAAVAITPVPAMRTYRDKVYSSRTLILPGDRTLPVIAGRVTVQADDTLALDYLRQHSDLEALE